MTIQYETDLIALNHLIAAQNAQITHAHSHANTDGTTHTHPSTGAATHAHPSTDGTTHAHPSTDATTHAHPSSGGITHAHPTTNGTNHTHSHSSTEGAIPPVVIKPDPNVLKAQNLRIELVYLNARIHQIQSILIWINDQHQQRKEHRKSRDERMQARLDLANHKPGVSINDTLSTKNQSDLKTKIRYSHLDIDALCSTLINQAQSYNYSCFLQQLELSFNSLQCSPQEIDALKVVLKLVKQHLEQTKTANTLQSELNKKIHNVNQEKSLLEYSKNRLKKLQESNPNLTQCNEQLAAKNDKLHKTQQQNNKLKDKFLLPTWILGGASLVSSTPVILAVTGVLAASLTPFLAIIPALILLASIGVGITALVYAIKARNNGNDIAANKRTIESNTNQMAQNQQELTTLQDITIPNYIKTISKQEQVIAQVRNSLHQEQLLAQQTLEQAKATEPVSFTQLYPKLADPLSVETTPPPTYGFFNLLQQQPLGYAQLLNRLEPSAPPMEDGSDQQHFSFH